MSIDVDYDITSGTPGFWDVFWDNDSDVMDSNHDPHIRCQTLRDYHRSLWSRPLPNGQTMEIENDYCKYLIWNNIRLGSEPLVSSLRYSRTKGLMTMISSSMDDYKQYIEDFVHRTSNIGNAIILPRRVGSISQYRSKPQIGYRWDCTLECIRRYYSGEWSPLEKCMSKNKDFLDLFVDFKGYVDFFLLQDFVSNNYSTVKVMLDTDVDDGDPLPKDIEEYIEWINTCLDLVEKRKGRIQNLVRKNGL